MIRVRYAGDSHIKKSIFSRAPRRTMWKWQTRCGQPRRLAKNPLGQTARKMLRSWLLNCKRVLNRGLIFAGGQVPAVRQADTIGFGLRKVVGMGCCGRLPGNDP